MANARKTIWTCIFALAGMCVESVADTITWDEPRNITGDSDVVTVGRLCYAYTKGDNAVTVNGVPFARAYNSNIQWNNYPLNDPYWNLGEANTTLTEYIGNDYFYPSGTPRPDTISDAYRQMLGLWVYSGSATAIKLRNFIVGHTYLVQIWMNNARADVASIVNNWYMSLDGQVALCLHPTGAPAGQYAIGRFTATGNEVTIEFRSSGLVGATDCFGYNAIQVRDVTPTVIDWEEPVTSYDDNDVRTDGELLLAFHGSHNDQIYTVNGVEFRAAGDYSATSVKQVIGMTFDVTGCGFMAYDAPTAWERANYNASYPSTASDDYKSMLGTFMYVNGANSANATARFIFTSLVPGERYLVQLWFDKSQRADYDRYLKVDMVRNVEGRVADAENRGQYIVGTFTACLTTQEFFLHGASHAQSISDGVNVTFSAIQLRHLPSVGKSAFSSGWTDVRYAQSADDVSTNGTLVGAYFASETAQPLSVNGVSFVSQQSTTSWGDGKVLLRGFPHGLAGNLMGNYTGTELGTYKTLLDTAVFSFYYSDADPDFKYKNPVNAEVTFTGLEPNTRYEVQAWVNDNTPSNDYHSASTGFGGEYRLVTFGTFGPFPYRSSEPPNLGPIGRARIIVEPGTTSYKLPIFYTTRDINQNEVRAYLNAVQIRRADTLVDPQDPEASHILEWTGYGTPWNTSAGSEYMALLTSGGTMSLSGEAHMGSVKACGPLTIEGPGPLDLVGEIFAPTCTVSTAYAGETIVKTRPGHLSITGEASHVNKILLEDGTLDFSPSVPPTEDVLLYLRGNSSLVLGSDLKVTGWDHDGTCTITRKGNAMVTVPHGWDINWLTIVVTDLAPDYKSHPVLVAEKGSLVSEPTFEFQTNGFRLTVEKRVEANGSDAYYLKPTGGFVVIVQ